MSSAMIITIFGFPQSHCTIIVNVAKITKDRKLNPNIFNFVGRCVFIRTLNTTELEALTSHTFKKEDRTKFNKFLIAQSFFNI